MADAPFEKIRAAEPMPSDKPPRKGSPPPKERMILLGGLLLATLIAYLLVNDYLAGRELQRASAERWQLELERTAQATGYFFSERRHDLLNLGDSREISVFFENQALGMSMRYGLRQSLIAIREKLLRLQRGKTVGPEPIYRRLALVDTSGVALIDTAPEGTASTDWRSLTDPSAADASIQVLPPSAEVLISLAYHFKGKHVAQLLAWLNTSAIQGQLPADEYGETLLYYRDHGRMQSLAATTGAGRPPEIGSSVPLDPIEIRSANRRLAVLGRHVEHTPLVVLGVKRAAQAFGDADSDRQVLALSAFVLLVAIGAIYIQRQGLRAVVLQTRMEESQLKEREIALKNRALEQEIEVRRQMEERLREAKNAAEAANNAKSEFLANASHELRTPMSGIMGMAEILLSRLEDPAQRRMARTIDRSAQALLRVLNDILDVSRIAAGRVEIKPELCELRRLLDQIVALMAVPADQKGLRLSLVVSREVPIYVRTDTVRLRQILDNLLGNAVKFTERGEICVRVRTAETGGERQLEFSVSDTGIGISESARQKIFESFAQADGSRSRSYGGLGLGLTISAQLTVLLGGRIVLDPDSRSGSVFRVRLPLDGPSQQPATAPAQARIRVYSAHRATVEGLREGLAIHGIELEAIADLGALTQGGNPIPTDCRALVLDFRDADVAPEAVDLPPAIPAFMLTNYEGLPNLAGTTALPMPASSEDLARQILQLSLPQTAEHTAQTRREAPSVLLVDDNPTNLEIGVAMLERLGCTVHTAENGALAVAAVADGGYRLVLMDLNMPVLNGIDATRRIRAGEGRRAPVPVVGVSADMTPPERDDCLAAGMDTVISKPFTQAKLEEVLHLFAVRTRAA